MNILARVLKISVITIFMLIFLLALYVAINTHTSRTGVLRLSGLSGEVTIRRDQFGIPHIKAEANDLDTFFALGYVHAQDRFWQMDFQRHIASGRLSELFGEYTIQEDKYLRTWGFARAAAESLKTFDQQTKDIISAYTDGVNAFLEQKRYPLQILLLNYRPEPWTDLDSVVWQKVMAWNLQTNWQKKLINYKIVENGSYEDVATLQPPYPDQAPTALYKIDQTISKQQVKPREESIRQKLGYHDAPGKGSNNWVVAGKLTRSGKPILANDPHLELTVPNLWYLAELQGPTLHVIGSTIPGLPAVLLGHNNKIAWGVTNVDANTQDLYIECSKAKFETVIETIYVKGGDPVQHPVRFSTHGPILSDVEPSLQSMGENVALKWVALMPNDTSLASFLKINYAQDWTEFKNALAYFVSPAQNFVYADIAGNIGYHMSGRIPIREGWLGELPVNSDENKEWAGYIPFDEMPHLYNPESGIIATANNKVTDANYPYQINFRWDVPPYRIERILDLLQQHEKFDLAVMKEIQMDTKSQQWLALKDNLLATQPLDEVSKNILDELRNWDGEMTADSSMATVFAYWRTQLNTLLPQEISQLMDWPEEPLFIQQQLQDDGSYCKRAGYANCQDFQSKSLKHAIETLQHDRGRKSQQWRWGSIHKAKFKALGIGDVKVLGWLWNRSIGTQGDAYTVNAASYDSQYQQVIGPGYRQVIDLGNLARSEYIQALGQIDSPFSKHHADFMQKWRDGVYIPMHISEHSDNDKVLILLPKL